jgi:hypothetical protein
MTHDPLCPYEYGPKFHDRCPMCRLIAKVRQDERERAGIEQTVPSHEYPFTTRVRQATPDDGQSVILASECEKRIAEAQRDMLAKCIAAVRWVELISAAGEYLSRREVLAALRALQP